MQVCRSNGLHRIPASTDPVPQHPLSTTSNPEIQPKHLGLEQKAFKFKSKLNFTIFNWILDDIEQRVIDLNIHNLRLRPILI